MDRFHVAGWRRWILIEPLSEAATWGAAGFLLMLACRILGRVVLGAPLLRLSAWSALHAPDMEESVKGVADVVAGVRE